MDDKELIKRIKNSFSVGLSRAEIMRRMQKQGYRLEYIEALIKKTGKKKIIISSCILIMVLILGFLSYIFILGSGEKMVLANPLGFVVSNLSYNNPTTNETSMKITPSFINYLLNEIGAYKLHRNLLTGEAAVINFRIDDKNFYSVIDREIESFEGSDENADLKISISRNDLIATLKSNNPRQLVENFVAKGRIKIVRFASKGELVAKGYWGFIG